MVKTTWCLLIALLVPCLAYAGNTGYSSRSYQITTGEVVEVTGITKQMQPQTYFTTPYNPPAVSGTGTAATVAVDVALTIGSKMQWYRAYIPFAGSLAITAAQLGAAAVDNYSTNMLQKAYMDAAGISVGTVGGVKVPMQAGAGSYVPSGALASEYNSTVASYPSMAGDFYATGTVHDFDNAAAANAARGGLPGCYIVTSYYYKNYSGFCTSYCGSPTGGGYKYFWFATAWSQSQGLLNYVPGTPSQMTQSQITSEVSADLQGTNGANRQALAYGALVDTINALSDEIMGDPTHGGANTVAVSSAPSGDTADPNAGTVGQEAAKQLANAVGPSAIAALNAAGNPNGGPIPAPDPSIPGGGGASDPGVIATAVRQALGMDNPYTGGTSPTSAYNDSATVSTSTMSRFSTRVTQFMTDMKNLSWVTQLFGIFGNAPSGGSCTYVIDAGRWGSYTLNFCPWGTGLGYIRTCLVILAALICTRWIILKH